MATTPEGGMTLLQVRAFLATAGAVWLAQTDVPHFQLLPARTGFE